MNNDVIKDAAREINLASFRNEYADAELITRTAQASDIAVHQLSRIEIAYALAEAGYDMAKIRRRFA